MTPVRPRSMQTRSPPMAGSPLRPEGPAVVKGRQGLIVQARRDHRRFGNEPSAAGEPNSIMRHLISNSAITITGRESAIGSCYVTTMVKKGDIRPAILRIFRYTDHFAKQHGEWRIRRREITIEFGNVSRAT